jgi:hypothetical protein
MNPIFTPEAMIRTSVLRKVGGANPELPHTSDLNLWLRIASETDIAYLAGHLQALYRRHSSNHSAAYLRSISMEMQQRWAAFEQFFLTAASHPKRAEWEMLVRKALANESRYRAAREFSLAGSAGSDYKALLKFADALDPAISSRTRREFAWAIRIWMGPKAANLMPTLWVTRIRRLLQRYLWKRRARRIGI